MKNIVAAIARVLAAMAQFVVEKVLVAGQWVWSLVRKPAAAPMQDLGLGANDNAALEAGRAAEAALDYDLEMGAIRTVAAHLRSGFTPPAEMCAELDEKTMVWLASLPEPMLEKILRAEPADLRAHVMGRKAIKGVLINAPETVELFNRRRDDDVEDELELVRAARYA